MAHESKFWLLSLAILSLVKIVQGSLVSADENGLKTAVFLSPKFELEPGLVSDKFHYDIDFPRGHIAIKDFNAEVIDEAGNSVPLHETYLHHWAVMGYYQRKGVEISKYHSDFGFYRSDYIIAKNNGLCDYELPQYWGLGSETRKTITHVPDPYGIEVGNPMKIPAGYEEKWLLNIHAIDTRGTEDRLGCTECRCDLYNVTIDSYGRFLDPDYIGGLRCCYDRTRCRVKEGFQSMKRSLYLKYTVKYLDWHAAIVPVKIYILDVTDRWTMLDDTKGLSSKHDCQIEYQVESCSSGLALANDGCSDTKKLSLIFPEGGDVIYGVAHQHIGGIGSTLYGEDGRVICSSNPIYGEGKEPGNEAGYIVGMSTCYPKSGSVKISNGENLTLISKYNSSQRHTGVMGLFYILVVNSDSSSKSFSFLHAPVGIHRKVLAPHFIWGFALFAIVLLVAVVTVYLRWNERGNSYEPITI